jgi:hypothetical protein
VKSSALTASTNKVRKCFARNTFCNQSTWFIVFVPKTTDYPALLPIGETAQFRISKDKLILRVPEVNDKERDYIVVSMTPRGRDVASESAGKN